MVSCPRETVCWKVWIFQWKSFKKTELVTANITYVRVRDYKYIIGNNFLVQNLNENIWKLDTLFIGTNAVYVFILQSNVILQTKYSIN